MSKITKKSIIEKCESAFNTATEDLMNGESMTNIKFKESSDKIKVEFDIDLGRGGIDSYYTSSISFIKEDLSVSCELGESLEGSGIEDMTESLLEDFAKEIWNYEIVEDIINFRKMFEEETNKKLEVTRTFSCDECESDVAIDTINDEYIFWLEKKLNIKYNEKYN